MVCSGRGPECRCESRFVDLVGGLKGQWVVRVTDSDRVDVKERVERMTAVRNCVVSMDCARGLALVGLGGRR